MQLHQELQWDMSANVNKGSFFGIFTSHSSINFNQNLFFYSNLSSNATPNCCLQSPTVWLIKSHFKELWSCEKRATHEK